MQSPGPGSPDTASAFVSNLPLHTRSHGFTPTVTVPGRPRETRAGLGQRTGEQPGLTGPAGKSKRRPLLLEAYITNPSAYPRLLTCLLSAQTPNK